ncbi:MAG TPA: lysophospholipid acyltransferase family protein [Candidatus Dormibacteraeota bacterium]|nr:lysophospholipid acyltransferase family protein [Candidatus Dormibacteraeota bacterium]
MTSPLSTASASGALPEPSRPQLLAASYRAGARILRAVPPGVRYAAATPGGSAWFLLSAGQRRAALDNYAAALGAEPGDPRVARVARRAFQNYGRMLMDFVLLGGLTPEELGSRMSYDGRDHLDAALERGRGAIMAVPHMGSWDMAGSFAASLGYRVWAVAEKFPGSLDDAVVKTRESFGLKVVSIGRSAVRTLTEALRDNGIIALVCDLEQGPGVAVRFFGRRAVVPGGPAALALKNGATVITAAPYAVSPGHYHVHLDPPMEIAAGETKEGLMQRIVTRFEDFIRERPDQWYAFRRMFDR